MTADSAPLVGRPSPSSRVRSLLGCDVSGLSPLRSAASLAPGVLGDAALSAEQAGLLELGDVERSAPLPIARDDRSSRH